MSVKLFCVLLGLFMGVAIVGVIWIIAYELGKDDKSVGRRTNRHDEAEWISREMNKDIRRTVQRIMERDKK